MSVYSFTWIFCVLFVVNGFPGTSSFVVDVDTYETPTKEWDYLAMVQFWPPTSCYIYFGKEKCHGIPAVVKGWTIHGLWPSGPGSHYPEYCNHSLKFDYNKIKSLGAQLLTQWPNLDSESKTTELWSHEWEKHGTCAVSVSRLSTEFDYFNVTLGIHGALNTTGALAKRGITPSDDPYTASDIYNALLAEYGVKPNIVCEKKDEKYYLDQVYVCLSKSFVAQDCISSSGEPFLGSLFVGCPDPQSREVIYMPFNTQQIPDRPDNILEFISERDMS
ncbi:ribonuclease Oy [Aplysia californica]|uniref:Ribonuclease Oy n=1 Tax=Aplysia californica TaxID=6500 RepID=A0ABM0ZV19_APLCA|nr:ribonuclease Oy [Aplysia californica]